MIRMEWKFPDPNLSSNCIQTETFMRHDVDKRGLRGRQFRGQNLRPQSAPNGEDGSPEGLRAGGQGQPGAGSKEVHPLTAHL